MLLIDRYILVRLASNFVLLFALLFTFAAAIDIAMALQRFTDAVHAELGDGAGVVPFAMTFAKLVFQFQGPRLFQFYAYMHGLIAIGAMGFTLAQLYRYRELIAMLAAGLSMHRIAMPFVMVAFGLSVVQLLNQEFLLPRVAPLLLREHEHIGRTSIDRFPIALTPDAAGNVMHSPEFDPTTGVLAAPTFLERDEQGRTVRRVTAESARWRESTDDGARPGGWVLADGREVTLARETAGGTSTPMLPRAIDFIATDMSPELLLVQRYNQFAAMLSLRQISAMLATQGVVEQDALRRFQYARFSSVLVNILVMWLTLPTFLIREPANLLRRALTCAMIAIPSLLGSSIFMVMDLPGIPPALSVFLPVVILIPVVLAQWTFIKT